MKIVVEYDGGMNELLDRWLDDTAAALGGHVTGSGCFLVGEKTRDRDYVFSDDRQAAAFQQKILIKDVRAEARANEQRG